MQIEIPGAARSTCRSLNNSIILIHGESKIGKSTLAADFEGVWFITSQKPEPHLMLRDPIQIRSYTDLINTISWFKKNNPTQFKDGTPIKTLVWETLGDFHDWTQAYVCKQMDIEHPSDMPVGKGWDRLNVVIRNLYTKLIALPYTIIIVAHSEKEEIDKFKKKQSGRSIMKPDAGKASRKFFLKNAHHVLYAHSTQKEVKDKDGIVVDMKEVRALLIKPQSWASAGIRLPKDIATPTIIPMSYKALLKQFPDTDNYKQYFMEDKS